MIRIIIGPLTGAVIGYVYYRLIGCSTGACPITSNPWASMLYGAVLGFMMANIGTGE